MTTISTDSVTEFVGRAMSPLVERLSSDAAITDFVARLGWDLPSVPGVFTTIHDSAAALRRALGTLTSARLKADQAGITSSTASVGTAFAAVVASFESIGAGLRQALPASYIAETAIDTSLERRLLDFILSEAINGSSQAARGVLVALGILEETPLPADAGAHRPAFTLKEFRLDRLQKLFGSPSDVLRDVYGWGTPDINAERLYRTINVLSLGLSSPAELVFPSDLLIDSMFPNLPAGARVGSMLNVPLASGGVVGLEVGIFPAPKMNAADNQALAFRLLGAPQGTIDFGVGGGLTLTFGVHAALDTGIGMVLEPGKSPRLLVGVKSAPSALTQGGMDLTLRRSDSPAPLRVLSFGDVGGLDVRSYNVKLGLDAAPADLSLSAGIEGGKLTLSLGSADGFLRSVIPGDPLVVDFDIGIGWSKSRGVFLTGSGGLETLIVLNLGLGPLLLQAIRLAVKAADDGITVSAGVAAQVTLGPFTAVVQGMGVESRLRFAAGNLGPMDLGAAFLPPTGLGLSIDGPGGITGGGFLAFEPDLGRYSGALELQVFGVGVKAFGLLETRFPDGREGFSFIILISAEFTPVQIGFGFTLNGVGGLLGLNRSLVDKALGDAVRSGSIEHLLFPRDPIHDAPAILNDIETIFPATQDHYVLGPLAKLGWGTPTLITAELGIVIELPGPRLAVLGTAQTALPTRQISLIRLNLAIAGLLDFPKRLFALDASLYDSVVGSFPVSGDASFRMSFGDDPNFVFSIGGFNPSFKAPPNFPKLRRASVDLGVNGNPSLTLSGYFALTSNTAQIGAAIALRASGAGIVLEGHVSFDALFVFSPFSFEADLDAGMSVSFHGIGIGIHFHGHLSGPSPFRVSGDVCVSILFWDACLGVSATFGKSKKAELPAMDPWDVHQADPQLAIIGLQEAVADSRNWHGSPPPSFFSVVSLADNTNPNPPIDPLGAATLRQKVVPLGQKLTRFGTFKPVTHTKFDRSDVHIGATLVPPEHITKVTDRFASDTFKSMSAAERLSARPYDVMEAGFTLDPDVLHAAHITHKDVEFETVLLDGNRAEVGPPPPNRFRLTQRHLRAMLLRSAAGLSGVRNSGLSKYVVPNGQAKVRLRGEDFVVADACAFTLNHDVTAAATTRIQAALALEDHLIDHPEDVGRFAVVPSYELSH